MQISHISARGTKRACVYVVSYTYEARPRRTIRTRERLAKLATERRSSPGARYFAGIDNAELVLMHSRINAPFMNRTKS